ncbi:DUF1918 domain-containing protein [Cryptosporangium arvum]|uniref:DUF1918 domain-containing protein n=1 Tax=Cryptosporangium arvum DSM 44712 TaxID=927661 RepID=A0A010ZZ10_9ACTN|nr:DUF1918 domain-containing protein [Cryptosporangium arvum]EXG82452.1 protein of unknown function DUF1918 [Cryptosporangium arvum DSM 44712]
MNAHRGDEILLQPPGAGHPVRDGEVIGVDDPDGFPPYLVRWSDGRTTLLYPGPDAQVKHLHGCGSPPDPTQD